MTRKTLYTTSETTLQADLDDIANDEDALNEMLEEVIDCTHIYEEAAVLSLALDSGDLTLLSSVEAYREAGIGSGKQQERFALLRTLVVVRFGIRRLKMAMRMAQYIHLADAGRVIWERYGLDRPTSWSPDPQKTVATDALLLPATCPERVDRAVREEVILAAGRMVLSGFAPIGPFGRPG